jgi:hypothetical protein
VLSAVCRCTQTLYVFHGYGGYSRYNVESIGDICIQTCIHGSGKWIQKFPRGGDFVSTLESDGYAFGYGQPLENTGMYLLYPPYPRE